MRTWLFYGAFLFPFLLSSNVNGKETILWMQASFPPYYIIGEKGGGLGSFNLVEQFLIDSLWNYDHQREIANIDRIYLEFEKKKNICTVGFIKTPAREAFMEFSVPALLLLSNRLIVLESQTDKLQPFIDANQAVDLDKLLKSDNFVLGVARSRSYGLAIDEILEKNSNRDSVSRNMEIDQFLLRLRMLDAKRPGIDAVLGFPLEVGYQSSQFGKKLGPFEYYLLSEAAPYVISHVSCSKSEFGRKVINQINELVKKNRADRFAGYYETWLDIKLRPSYREFISKEFTNP